MLETRRNIYLLPIYVTRLIISQDFNVTKIISLFSPDWVALDGELNKWFFFSFFLDFFSLGLQLWLFIVFANNWHQLVVVILKKCLFFLYALIFSLHLHLAVLSFSVNNKCIYIYPKNMVPPLFGVKFCNRSNWWKICSLYKLCP